MAKYANDFTQYPIGIFPSDWEGWSFQDGMDYEGAMRIVPFKHSSFGDRVAKIYDSNTNDHVRAFIWNEVPSASDLEMVAKIWFDPLDATKSFLGCLRAELLSTSDFSWYQSGFRTGDLDFNKYVNGNFTNLANDTSQDWGAEGVWLWLRFRVEGTSLYLRVWEDSVSEPSTWNLTDTDTSLSSGRSGFLVFRRDSITYVDFVGFGTDGDSAPKTLLNPVNQPANLNTTSITDTSATLDWDQG